MGGHTVHHREQAHTPRGKRIKEIPDIDLFLELCFIYYIPPPPPTLLLACILSFVIVRQTQIHQNNEFPPPFSPVGRVVFSVLSCVSDTGHWEKMYFRRTPPPFIVVLPLFLLLLILHRYFSHQHHVTLHEKVTWSSLSPDLLLTRVL